MCLQTTKQNQTNLGYSIEIFTKVIALKYYVDDNIDVREWKTSTRAKSLSGLLSLTKFYFIDRSEILNLKTPLKGGT